MASETEKTRVIRCEITVKALGADPERPYRGEDGALMPKALTVATHRPADKAITFLDAFESVGITVTDVSHVSIGDATPTSDDIFSLGNRWYAHEIQALARSILSDLKDETIAGTVGDADEWLLERLHGDIDGHNWIIYTAKARLVNAFTDSPDAYADAYGDVTPTDEQRAYASMEADVNDAIRHLRDEFGFDAAYNLEETDDDDSDDDEDDE